MDHFRKAHKMSRIKTMRLRKDNPNLKIKLKQILRGYLNNDTSSIRRYADFTDVSTQEDVLETDLDNSFYQSVITFDQSSSATNMKNENSIQDFTGTKTEKNKRPIKKVNSIEQSTNENQAVLNDIENGDVTTQNTCELYIPNKYEDINSKINMSVTVKDKVKKKTKKLEENKNSQKNFIGPKFRGATKRNLKSIKGATKVEHSFGYSSIDNEEKFDKSGKLASKILKRLPKIQKKTTDYSVDTDTSSVSDLDFPAVLVSSSSSNSSSNIFHEQHSPSEIVDIESSLIPSNNSIDTNMSDVSVESIKDIESFFTSHGTKEINTYRHSVLDQTHKNVVDFFRNKSLPADAEIFPAISSNNSSENDDRSVTSEVFETISKIESGLFEDMDIENTDTNIPPKFYRIKKGCIAVLSYPSKLYCHGKLKATILCGHVEIFGYKLTDQPCRIYASQCSYSLYFATFPYDTSTYGLFSKLTSIGFPVIQTEEIVTSLSAHDSIIYLEELNDGTVDFLINNFNSSLFYTSSSEFEDVFEVPRDALQCAMYKYKPARSLQDNSMWVQVVNHGLGTTSKTLICGGKDVGKSTLMRYYINKLLAQSSVAVIDLDPGQCEFTICGNVSVTVIDKPLIGVNFTHLQESKRILNIGMINVTNNIEKYINALQELMVFCKEDKAISALPWVINTMGMIDSLGLELIAYIVKLFEPTIVVQIKCNVPKRNFTMAITPENLSTKFKSNFNCTAWLGDVSNRQFSFNYFLVNQEIHGNGNKHTKQQRYLNLLAYFGQISTSGFLNEVKPYMVPIDSIKIGLNEELHELYKKVINGKVVALGFDDNSEHKMGSVFKLGVEPLICYGHGLVRGIDNESGRMYIITPLSVKKLRLVNTVVYSDILPDLALNNACYRPDTFVPYCANLIRKSRYRQLMNSPKRRFNPLQLLNVKKGS